MRKKEQEFEEFFVYSPKSNCTLIQIFWNIRRNSWNLVSTYCIHC